MATPAERSRAVFPGGSLGAYNLPPELTVVLERGEGATVWDSDGRAFLDFTRGWGLANPMSTKLYPSLAHTEADVARFLELARLTLREDCR